MFVPSPMLGDSYTLDLESCLSHGLSMIRDTYYMLRCIELQPGAHISCKSLSFKPREEVILLSSSVIQLSFHSKCVFSWVKHTFPNVSHVTKPQEFEGISHGYSGYKMILPYKIYVVIYAFSY